MSSISQNSDTSKNHSSAFISLIIMTSVSLVMIAAGSARGGFGVFFKPMANDLGWSAGELSSSFSFSMIIEGIISALSGWLSDKFGTRIVLVISAIISGIGFALMSQVHEIWQMYLIYGLAMGIGLGGLVVPVISMVARRFTSKRSLMTGITLAANGTGQLISPLIAHQLITTYDWRTSYVIMGIIVLVLVIIPAQFIKKPHRKTLRPSPTTDNSQTINQIPASDPDNFTFEEARHTRTFWMMMVFLGFYGFCFLSTSVHLVPYAIEIGISSATAASLQAIMGAASVGGRLGLGLLADKIGNRKIIIVGLLAVSLSLVWLALVKETWAIFIFSIVCGISLGGIASSQSPLSAKFFGSRYHGSVFGAIGGGTVIIAATGPFIAGLLFDITGQYTLPFLFCAFLALVGAIMCMMLKRPRKSG